jgi:hypothetical protein
MAVKSIGAGFVPRNQPAPIQQEDDRMSSEAPTPPQAPKPADDCITIGELAEFAADLLADVSRLRDRVTDLETMA